MRTSACFAGLLAVIVATSASGQSTYARWRDTLRFREVTHTDVRLTTPQGEMPITNDHAATVAVIRLAGDTARAWYEALDIAVSSAMGEQRPSTTEVLKAPFTFTMDPRGRVRLVSAPKFPARFEVISDLTRQFDDFFVHLPAQPLRLGLTWTDTTTQADSTAEKSSKRQAIATYRVERDTIVAGTPALVIGMKQELRFRSKGPWHSEVVLLGTEDGIVVFAPQEGRLLGRQRTGTMAGDLTMSGAAGQMSMKQSFTYKNALTSLNTLTSVTPAGADRRIVTAATRARIDSTLRHFVDAGDVAGISALVYEKGSEAYFNAFGYADREAKRPMSRDAIVQIYSMTKPVTGVALMQLFEQRKFRLDDPVSKYIPELANVRVYGGTDGSGNPVLAMPHRAMTVRDLTRHTAGFATSPDNPGVGPLLRAANPGDPNNTLTQEAAKLGTVPLWFHPGEKWEYGPSVDMQALLVERLSGQPFDRYLQDHVLGPLEMHETRYVVPASDLPRFAAMYVRADSGGLTHVPDENAHAFNLKKFALSPGSYGLTSTVDDYMRLARMLLGRGTLEGTRLLKPETVRLMSTSHLSDSVTSRSWLPSKGQVGFGIDFAVRVRPPASAEENNGVVGEFFWDGAASTLFWVDPANDLAAVLFVQLMPFDRVHLHKSFRDAVYGVYRGPVSENR